MSAIQRDDDDAVFAQLSGEQGRQDAPGICRQCDILFENSGGVRTWPEDVARTAATGWERCGQ